ERDAMRVQQVVELCAEPGLVAHFQGEADVLRQALQERHQAREKGIGRRKRHFVEVRELEQQHSQLLAQELHALDEFLKLFVAVLQDILVRDGLWDLCGEEESRRRFYFPTTHGGRRWRAVVGAVNLHGVKILGVEREVVGGLHALGVKGSLPPRRGKRRGAQTECAAFRHRRFSRSSYNRAGAR